MTEPFHARINKHVVIIDGKEPEMSVAAASRRMGP